MRQSIWFVAVSLVVAGISCNPSAIGADRAFEDQCARKFLTALRESNADIFAKSMGESARYTFIVSTLVFTKLPRERPVGGGLDSGSAFYGSGGYEGFSNGSGLLYDALFKGDAISKKYTAKGLRSFKTAFASADSLRICGGSDVVAFLATLGPYRYSLYFQAKDDSCTIEGFEVNHNVGAVSKRCVAFPVSAK